MVEQIVDASRHNSSESIGFYTKHRKLLSILIPVCFVQLCWWVYIVCFGSFDIFDERIGNNSQPIWYVVITMVFGSMIAGSTSEGGAAIAFPVLTLAMDVSPAIARNFSFMIQSVGMSCASFTILFMKVKLEYHSVLYCTIGGTIGVIIGLIYVAPQLSPAYTKMFFVSVWFSFSCLLLYHNVLYPPKDKVVYHAIPYWKDGKIFEYSCEEAVDPRESDFCPDEGAAHKASFYSFTINWKAVVLLSGGFVGGVFTSLGGSGLDICSFSILTLLFNVSERVATPTSIVLMAINSLVAFLYIGLTNSIQNDCWAMWLSCVPVVVVGAPLGSIVSSHWHRLVIAWLVIVIDTIQLLGALIIIEPWTTGHTDHPLELSLESLGLFVLGIAFFSVLVGQGRGLVEHNASLSTDCRQEEESKYAEVGGTGCTAAEVSKAGIDNDTFMGTSDSESRTNPMYLNDDSRSSPSLGSNQSMSHSIHLVPM